MEVIDPLGTVSPTVAPATAGGTAHQAQAHALTRKATVHTFLTSTAMRGWKTISTGILLNIFKGNLLRIQTGVQG